MKTILLFAAGFFAASASYAEQSFPGLKQLLTEAEWNRAGLSRLSPDEIGVIDAALIRHHGELAKKQDATIREVRAAAATEAAAPARKGLWQRFGLPSFEESDWQKQPPMQAKVTRWVSANRFELDNGQTWEGVEPITYDIAGKDIEILARPHGQFALSIDGKSTTLRVMRLR